MADDVEFPADEQPEGETPAGEPEGSAGAADAQDESADAAAESALEAARAAIAGLQNLNGGDSPDSGSAGESPSAKQAAPAQGVPNATPEINSTDPAPAGSPPPASAPATGSPVQLPEWSTPDQPAERIDGIELLSQVALNVRIELGRTRMMVEDVLRLDKDAVVELDKLAGDPVDVYVNDQLVAHGEILVVNDTFCVRVSDIVTEGPG
jgi:flagellar motor switch protein FliN/FliY